ncbi:MAG: glutamate racemase [Candidatus Geothermincolia bacterium]
MLKSRKTQKQSPIGVFDSGVGGLTVVRSVIDRLPNESIIYFGDTARGPYGPLELEVVRRYALEITDFLEQLGVKLIVVACNSATAAGLAEVQEASRVPVIGVIEPGVRAAVRSSRNRRVGVIGTKATITSGAYSKEIAEQAPDIHITTRACPRLVEFVERGEVEGEELRAALREYLGDMLESGIDTLILGCTHYPLLRDAVSEVAGEGVRLISSAETTAIEVEQTLRRDGLERDALTLPAYRFLCSGDTETAKMLGKMFLGPEVEQVEKATI